MRQRESEVSKLVMGRMPLRPCTRLSQKAADPTQRSDDPEPGDDDATIHKRKG